MTTDEALPPHPDLANRTEVVRVDHQGYTLTEDQSERLTEWVEEVFGDDIVAAMGTVDSITYYIRKRVKAPK